MNHCPTIPSLFVLVIGAAAILSADAAPFSAAQPALSADASQSARFLQRGARQLHPTYGVPPSRQSSPSFSANSDGAAGEAYEFSAVIDGRVSSGGEEMLMLRAGSEAVSLDAMVPHGFSAPWLTSGTQVRLVARSLAGSSTNDDLSSRADCQIVAAAPEGEVLLLEHPGLSRLIAPPPRLAPQLTSRSAAYSRNDYAPQSARFALGHPVCQLSSAATAVYPLYRDQIHRLNGRLDDQTLDKITSSILGYSDYYRVDPRLIMAMMIAESHFDPNAVSRTGAIGLGQLMPETAAGLAVDPWDVERSIGASVKILSSHVAQYGGADSQGLVPLNTLLLTMAAYNAGGGAVKRYHGVPPYRETQAYVHKVASYYRQLCGS